MNIAKVRSGTGSLGESVPLLWDGMGWDGIDYDPAVAV